MKDLAEVSAALADEREEIQAALAAVADAVGHRRDVRARQPRGPGHRRREAHPGHEDDQLREGQHRHRADASRRSRSATWCLAFDPKSGSIGSRIGIQRQRLGRRRLPVRDRPAVRPARGQQGPRLHALRADRSSRSRTSMPDDPAGRAAGRGSRRRRADGARGTRSSDATATRRPRSLEPPARGWRHDRRALRSGRRAGRRRRAADAGVRVRRRLRPAAARLAGRRGRRLRGHRGVRRHPQRRARARR